MLPTGAAVFFCAAPAVARLGRRRRARFFALWVLFHGLVGGFFGLAHQAGVAPLIRSLASPDGRVCDHVGFLGTYMPPRSLLGGAERIFLHDFENDEASLGARIDNLGRWLDWRSDLPCRGHALRFAVARSASLDAAADALAARGAALVLADTFAPHFTGEIAPTRLGDLALDLYDVVDAGTGRRWRLPESATGRYVRSLPDRGDADAAAFRWWGVDGIGTLGLGPGGPGPRAEA